MITSKNLKEWCEATSKTNQEFSKLRKDRRENNDWMGKEIRSFFEQFTEVDKVIILPDGSMILVYLKGKLDLKDSRLQKLPMPMEIGLDGIELQIRLYPDIVKDEP